MCGVPSVIFTLVLAKRQKYTALNICKSPSISCFRRQLKTFFYNLAFSPS